MPRSSRRLAAAVLGSVFLTQAPGEPRAEGWLGSAALTPIEARIAVAAGPDRTTTWTSLRLEAAPGAVGMVVPVPPGASLDWSSDAWLEALEIATAPRVFPPAGVSPVCPGADAGRGGDPFEVAGALEHTKSVVPDEAAILPDAAAVAAWAEANALALAPALEADLAAQTGARFFVARFTAAGGAAVSPTLRVVAPGAAPALPLALTRAGASPLRVTSWLLGAGRGGLTGAPEASIAAAIAWDAAEGVSTYRERREQALAQAAEGAALIEATSHEALAEAVPIASGTASIDGVLGTYLERAAAYLGAPDPAECLPAAAAALASSSAVATSCPRADLGVVDGTPSCVEAPVAGQIDPAKLRCGGAVDDLAVAFSGLSPAAVRLTRHTSRIAPGAAGHAWPVAFGEGPALEPILEATALDLSGCDDAGGTGSGRGAGSSGSSRGTGGPPGGSSGGAGSGVSGGDGYVYHHDPYADVGCDCSGTETVGYHSGGETDEGGGETEPAEETGYAYQDDDGCSSDSSETASGDDCGGDSSDPSSSGDGCSGQTESGYDYQEDDGCSGESAGSGSSDSCGDDGSSSGTDSCSGDGASSTGDGCSGSSGGGEDCSVARGRRRSPRLSALTLGALALLAPLRRAGRARRRVARIHVRA